MKLEMYDIRDKVSDIFVHILPPLKQTAELMVDKEIGSKLLYLCEQADKIMFALHRALPREVEVLDNALVEMLGLKEDEMEVETDVNSMLTDVLKQMCDTLGTRDDANKNVWHRNGRQLRLINGNKREKGQFAKDKGEQL